MTPPDQPEEQPSALSRLERALAGFSETSGTEVDQPATEPAAAPADPAAPASEPDPLPPLEEEADVDGWAAPSEIASSPVLDIAGAVEAVERLSAARDEGDVAPPSGDALLTRSPSDADEFVFAASVAGTRAAPEAADDEDDASVFQPGDLRERVKEFTEEEADEEELRVGVDEGSDLAPAPESVAPADEIGQDSRRVTDAAESWSRDVADPQLPYFLVEDNLPVAAEPVPTLEELRQTLPDEKKQRTSVARTLAEIPILLLVAAFIAFLVKTFLAQAYYIPSGSMQPQLRIDDRVVVSKLSYDLHDPRRGDIVVFDDPRNGASDGDDDGNLLRKIGEGIGIVQPSTDEFIKRVIGLPGETVEGRDGHVYVNDRLLIEPYLAEGVVTSDFPKTRVREGRLWVMGDNRAGSADSRVFGQIEIDSIVGRAVATVWPFGHIEFL